MNHTNLIFVAFSLLVGILVFAIWSNTHVFAQQSPSLSSSSLPPDGGSDSSSPSNPISSELKSKICDPSNPTLKVVNTTEARICGIPKTVKPPIASAATPQTTPVVLSPSTQQTTTTKSTTAATNTATPPKQQQIASTNNNTNAISRSTNSVAGATIAPVSNASNKSLSSTSSSSAIAPQVKAISQQQQPPAPLSITLINSTAGQNDTFAAAFPVVASGKLMYLGYHGGDSTPTNGDSSPNYKSSSDIKPSTHRSGSTTSDDDSTGKKKTSSTKLDRAESANKDSSSSTNDGSESLSLLPDLESPIKNKVDSIIKNTISSIKDNTPFLLPFP